MTNISILDVHIHKILVNDNTSRSKERKKERDVYIDKVINETEVI